MPDLEYYLAQARRIEEHREEKAEIGMRKVFKNLYKDLKNFLSDEYIDNAEEGQLSYEILQKKARYARFIEEIEERVIKGTEENSKIVKQVVNDTYKAAFNGMIDAVKKADGNSQELKKAFKSVKYVKPETLKNAVENPVSGLTLKDTLEKNRTNIIYNIKQTVGIGLQNGDRYDTMAKRIAESLDGDYKKSIRIVRTEAHRVQQAGEFESVLAIDEKLKKGNSGMRYYKTWKTAKDERVRRSKGKNKADHRKMEGVTILVDEEFDLGNGVKAMAPGQSGNAANDINCRCRLSFRLEKVEENVEDNEENNKNRFTNDDERGIIKSEPLSIYFNSSENIFKNAKKVKPTEGYEDIFIHGDKTGFAYKDKNGKESYYTVREFVEILREDPNYKGGNIKLYSCETGADGATAAQSLANQLGVEVLAPTDVVWIDFEGNVTIGPNEFENIGKWVKFKPKKGVML